MIWIVVGAGCVAWVVLTGPYADRLPTRVRVLIDDLDLDDPRTEEELRVAYIRGQITLDEFERRVAVVVDDDATRLRRTVERVSGIGEDTSYALVTVGGYRTERQVAQADPEELREQVPNVGEQRADQLQRVVQRGGR